jgi:hypothetical protein
MRSLVIVAALASRSAIAEGITYTGTYNPPWRA